MVDKSASAKIGKVIEYLLLIILAVLFLAPLLWVILTSFKTFNEIFTGTVKWFPTTWTLENYQMAIQNYPLWTWTKNRAIVTLAVLLLSSVFCIMPAYGLAVTDFRGKTALVFIMMASIMIPKELSAIYSYKIISKLGLLDTYAAMILPQLGEAIGVFLLYNFFCTIPKEFRESCELDGGGHMTALWRIYLPMAGPVISVMMILSFVSTWNNFFWPLIVTFTNKSMTLPVGLATIMNSVSENSAARQYGLLMAISVLVSIPVLVLFISLQKQFVESVASSGIKG